MKSMIDSSLVIILSLNNAGFLIAISICYGLGALVLCAGSIFSIVGELSFINIKAI